MLFFELSSQDKSYFLIFANQERKQKHLLQAGFLKFNDNISFKIPNITAIETIATTAPFAFVLPFDGSCFTPPWTCSKVAVLCYINNICKIKMLQPSHCSQSLHAFHLHTLFLPLVFISFVQCPGQCFTP